MRGDESERVASYFQQPELEDALPITGPAPDDVGAAPRYSRTVGAGNAEERFPARTQEEAEASLEAITAYCRNCPISHHCAEEECAVYRAEAKALAVTHGDQEGDYYMGVDLSADVQP